MKACCTRCAPRKAAPAVAPRTAPPLVRTVLEQSGESLPDAIRDRAEARFGFDLGSVRIHRGEAAAEAARAVGASAWTVGRHIAFGAGAFRPGTEEGERLILHELAHVVQQRAAAPPAGAIPLGGTADTQEGEASRAAASRGTDQPTLRRQPLSAREEEMIRRVHAELGLAPPKAAPQGIVWLGNPALLSPALREGAALAATALREGRTPAFDHPSPDALALQERLAKDHPGLVPAPASGPRLKPKPRPLKELIPESWTPFQKQAFARKLTPVKDREGLTVGFLEWRSGVLHVVDLEGESVRTLAEKGLETPLLDPIDLIPFELVASLSVKAGTLAVRAGTRLARGAAARTAEAVAARKAETLLLREGGEALAAKGAGAADDAGEAALTALRAGEDRAVRLGGEAAEAALGSLAPRLPRPADPVRRLMDRHPGRLADPDGALAETFRRTADPANAKLRRAASAELKEIEQVLANGIDGRSVTRLEVVKPSSAGRRPDLVATLSGGGTERIEIRTLTSAPGKPTMAQAGAGLAKETEARLPSVSEVGQAILAKVKSTPGRPNQLAAPLAGVAPGGTVSVRLAAGSAPARAALDAEIARIAPRLPPELHGITVSWMERGASGALRTGAARYRRDGSGAWVLTELRAAP